MMTAASRPTAEDGAYQPKEKLEEAGDMPAGDLHSQSCQRRKLRSSSVMRLQN
jgi:hypothetical protein